MLSPGTQSLTFFLSFSRKREEGGRVATKVISSPLPDPRDSFGFFIRAINKEKTVFKGTGEIL